MDSYFTSPGIKLNSLYRAKYVITRNNYNVLNKTLYELCKFSGSRNYFTSPDSYDPGDYKLIKSVLEKNKLSYGFIPSEGNKPVGI